MINMTTTPLTVPGNAEYVDDLFVEEIWRRLDGAVDRTQIRKTALEVAAQFADAAVTMFVPILVQRQVEERLRQADIVRGE